MFRFRLRLLLGKAIEMMRLAVMVVATGMLAACSLNPLHSGDQAEVIDKGTYCGTTSQDSAAHYFATPQALGDWLDYRSITEIKPAIAADGGVIIVEMGQRPTGGYKIELDDSKTKIENDTLTLGMVWSAPRLDAAVSQALIAPCVAIKPPAGQYDRVRIVDQLGNPRGEAKIHKHLSMTP